ncbi:MAG TPA: ABC transporter ATP-binding protein [Clostridia bacterium]|nr:ABC transporter ATP-binding protein [Clostridia bacterium]
MKKYSNKDLLLSFIPYYKPYLGILSFDLLCASMTTVADMVLPLILRFMTNSVLEGQMLSYGTIARLTLFFLVLKIIDLFAGYYMAETGHIMGAKIETDMRRDVFHHLQDLSTEFFNEAKVGQIMARITSDLFDITEFSHHCPEEYFIGFIKMTFAFIILLRINIPLTLAIFILIPLMIFSASRFNKRMRRNFKSQRDHIGELNSRIEDTLLGVKVVKAFTNEDMEKAKFEKDNLTFLDIKKDTYKSMAGFHTVTKAYDGLMYIVVIALGGTLLVQGKIDSGDFVAYIMYVGTLLTTVRRIVEFTEQFQRGMTGIERFNEIMDTDIDIFDEEDAREILNPQGSLEFKNVNFGYEEESGKVLKNINIKVKAGENVALVGPSGGGKTTLCHLIPRFYEVEEGEILLDGTNIKDFTIKSLRQAVGLVQQDVYLFGGSVYDNILYGNPQASFEEVEEAARLAGAYDFISQLPQGFDTYVGERGVKLSGGQKQRISIARVFLKNPPILLLDEATSALDNTSERLVQKSLERLSQGRTTLTIAHRLSTIQNADRILVLDEGEIIEEGTHGELLEKKAAYYKLHQLSFPEEAI